MGFFSIMVHLETLLDKILRDSIHLKYLIKYAGHIMDVIMARQDMVHKETPIIWICTPSKQVLEFMWKLLIKWL